MFNDIKTNHLYLKNIDMEDVEFIFSEFSNDDVNRYLFDAEPMTKIEEAKELIDFYNEEEPRNQHRWVIVNKRNGEKIGTCGFHCWNREERTIEVGYDMLKEYWGNGLMHEAMEAILIFAKQTLDVRVVNAVIYPDNTRSIALIKKFGFEFLGKTKDYDFHGKKYTHKIYTKIYE